MPSERRGGTMKLDRRILVIAGAAVALAAGGVGLAQAVGGDSEEQITGPVAERAGQAALEAVGGGTVLEVEREDGDGAGVFEVEVQRNDGSQVEVHLDDRYQVVGSTPDDDTGEPEDETGKPDSDD
jgi:hypothetical protein